MIRASLAAIAILLVSLPVRAEVAGLAEAAPEVRQSPAELRSDSLDRLFASLHTTSDARQAKTVEQNIWKIWMSSDSPTAELLLQQATRAMDEGAPEPSLRILNRLIGAYPDFAEAWNKRATLYFLMKKYPESLADIDKVLDLEPRHFGALSGRGMIYQRQSRYGAALESYREALAINPAMESVKDAIEEIEKIERGI